MTTQEAKQYLRQYELINCRIDTKIEQQRRLRDIASSVSITYNNIGGTSVPGYNSRTATIVEKIILLEEEINNDIDIMLQLERQLIDIINAVPDGPMMRLLTLRYVSLLSFDAIASQLHYSIRHTLRLHGRALQKVARILDDGTKCH